MFIFPDSVSILAEALHETSATPVLWLTQDFDQNLPVAHVYKVGGSQSGPLAADRIAVDVFAGGRDEAFNVSEEIRNFLVNRHHESEAYGLIDRVSVEVTPLMVPYPSDTVNQFTATYTAHTRAL